MNVYEQTWWQEQILSLSDLEITQHCKFSSFPFFRLRCQRKLIAPEDGPGMAKKRNWE